MVQLSGNPRKTDQLQFRFEQIDTYIHLKYLLEIKFKFKKGVGMIKLCYKQ